MSDPDASCIVNQEVWLADNYRDFRLNRARKGGIRKKEGHEREARKGHHHYRKLESNDTEG